jgi:hypothetical protein
MNPEPTPVQRARALRAQRRSRIARIRKRVTALSLAAFIALFSTIYVQMAAGDDPALSTKTKTTKAQAPTNHEPTTDGASGAGLGDQPAVDQSSINPAPVTTGQS